MQNAMKILLPVAGAGAGYLATKSQKKKTQNALIGAGVGVALSFLLTPPKMNTNVTIDRTPNVTGGPNRGGRLLSLIQQLIAMRQQNQQNANQGGNLITTTNNPNATTVTGPTGFTSTNPLFDSAGINPDDPFNLGPNFGNFGTSFNP